MPLKHFRGCSCVVGTIHGCYIGGVQTLLTLLCVLQMILGHYGCFLRWATSVVGVIQVLPRNFKMLLGVVGVFLCVVNVCKCYEVLFECCARVFFPSTLNTNPFSTFVRGVANVFHGIFPNTWTCFFYLLFLNKYEFLKVYTSFVNFVLSFLKYNNFKS
jgi:hypothetical protein